MKAIICGNYMCPECGITLGIERDGKGGYRLGHNFPMGRCPNEPKKFEIPTVELKQITE